MARTQCSFIISVGVIEFVFNSFPSRSF